MHWIELESRCHLYLYTHPFRGERAPTELVRPRRCSLSPILCRVEVLSVGETMNRSREVLQRPFARLLLFGSVSRPLVSEVVTRTYLAGAPIALGVVSLPTAKAWVSSRWPNIAYCGRRLTLKHTVGGV